MVNLQNKLSEHGLVYIEVPDAARYHVFNPLSPLRFFYFQHVIHFSEPHLRNLLSANGFIEVSGGKRDRVDSGFIMPCLWGIYRYQQIDSGKIHPDFELALQIGQWFDENVLDPIGTLAKLAKNQTPVYLWGIGIHTLMMLAMSPLGQCNIKFLLDKDERIQSKTLNGEKIYPIDKLNEATTHDAVVIGPTTHGQAMQKYLLEKVEFTGQIISL